MNAPDRNAAISPRAGLTKLALEFIETNEGARSDQLAAHLGCDQARISIMLNPYLKRQALKSTKVRVEGHRKPLAFYEIVPQTRRHDPRVATGSVPGRPMKLGDSLDARQIAAAKGNGEAPKVPEREPYARRATTHRDAPANQVSASPNEHVSASAAHPQPAVGQNTGSAPVEKEASLGGAHRAASAPKAKAPAKAKGADDIRLAIGDDARLVITLGSEPESILISAEQTRRLGEFLVGTRGVWGQP